MSQARGGKIGPKCLWLILLFFFLLQLFISYYISGYHVVWRKWKWDYIMALTALLYVLTLSHRTFDYRISRKGGKTASTAISSKQGYNFDITDTAQREPHPLILEHAKSWNKDHHRSDAPDSSGVVFPPVRRSCRDPKHVCRQQWLPPSWSSLS